MIQRIVALTAAGVTVGLIAWAPLAPLLATQLFGVGPGDPAIWVMVPLVLLGVALVAGAVPARRAMRADPLSVLRTDH